MKLLADIKNWFEKAFESQSVSIKFEDIEGINEVYKNGVLIWKREELKTKD